MEKTLKTIEATAGQWDPHLDAVEVDANNIVRGLKCGVFTPTDLVDGDVYYKIVGASFIDEEASQGRHLISVDVIDEHYNRIQGARVWHGWPGWRLSDTGELVQVFPEFDERVQLTIFGSVLAEWGLYAGFDAWKVPGPYWVSCADGKSDTFWGPGLPWNRHVCFAGVFQRTVYHGQPAGTLQEVLLVRAEREQLIRFNQDAALQKVIFQDGFVPNSNEFSEDYGGIAYAAQRAERLDTKEVRVYYCPVNNYNQVSFVTRL